MISILLFIFLNFSNICYAQDSQMFQGEVNRDNINIRSDSTINSEIICKVNKGDGIEVIQELYDWYKIRLPKTASSFVKKHFVMLIDDKNARVLKDRVNIRLHPNESSMILGKVDKNEIVKILQDTGEWYKIEPVNNSFGWIHKGFVNKATLKKIEEGNLAEKVEKESGGGATIEGIINPYGKIFKRQATYKLISEDNKIFLLKGNKKDLAVLNYHKVKVTGKLISSHKQRYPLLEIIKIEKR